MNNFIMACSPIPSAKARSAACGFPERQRSSRTHVHHRNSFTDLQTPFPSSPYFSRRAAAGPDSPNTLYIPILFTGTGQLSQSASHAAPPKPPITECSSTVTILPVSFAARNTSSLSRGLMVCILITIASMPSAASIRMEYEPELIVRRTTGPVK